MLCTTSSRPRFCFAVERKKERCSRVHLQKPLQRVTGLWRREAVGKVSVKATGGLDSYGLGLARFFCM